MFHNLNSCIDFDQIFRICLPQEDQALIRFGGGVSSNNCCHGSALNILTFVAVPQPKPMHGFSPNFQDVIT